MPKYQVWVKAHHPQTLAVIAEVLVFEHEDRLSAERFAENVPESAKSGMLFGPFVLHQNPLFRTETRIPGWGALQYTGRITHAEVAGGGGGGPSHGAHHGGAGGLQQRCQCAKPTTEYLGRCVDCNRPV